MPSSAWTTATGEGSLNLSAGAQVQVLYVTAWLDSATNPSVRIMGTAFPRRVQFAGSWQLGTTDPQPSGANAVAMVFAHSIIFEFEDVNPAGDAPGQTSDHLYWKLRTGVTMKFKVFW